MFNRNRFAGLDYKKYLDLTDEEVQVRYNEIIEQMGSFLGSK